jgi:hypothetical protein
MVGSLSDMALRVTNRAVEKLVQRVVEELSLEMGVTPAPADAE